MVVKCELCQSIMDNLFLQKSTSKMLIQGFCIRDSPKLLLSRLLSWFYRSQQCIINKQKSLECWHLKLWNHNTKSRTEHTGTSRDKTLLLPLLFNSPPPSLLFKVKKTCWQYSTAENHTIKTPLCRSWVQGAASSPFLSACNRIKNNK